MFDLIEAVAIAQHIDLGVAQTVGVGAQVVDQYRAVTVGRDHQHLCQRGWYFAVDRGVGQAVEQDQTPEMPANMASPQKAGEKFFQGEFHGAAPAPPALTPCRVPAQPALI